MNQPTRCSN